MNVEIIENDFWVGNWHVAKVCQVGSNTIMYLGWDCSTCPGEEGEIIETGEFEPILFADIPDDVFEREDGEE